MPKAKSRDGRFIISAPDTAKTGCRLMSSDETEETKFDKEMDAYLQAVEGRDINLVDVANAIWFDCFDMDFVGLHLLAKRLKCHVTVGERKYEFVVTGSHNSVDSCLIDIASQLKL